MGIYQENNIPQSGKFLAGHQTIEEVWGILFPENELVFSWRQIRFLAFGKNASFHRKRRNNADADTDKSAEEKENLYKTYYIPKSWGKYRIIREPCVTLWAVQRGILKHILTPALSESMQDACTGFRQGFSIIDNAAYHRNKQILVKLDIADFFPSISQARVYGFFKKRLWASHEVASYLSGFCTYQNQLPQWASTSPMIANLIGTRIDFRILRLMDRLNKGNTNLNLSYSRYADDLSLSYNDGDLKPWKLITYIENIIESEGFMLNLSKIRVFKNSAHQEVTGITVNNDTLSIGRRRYKFWRSVLHTIKVKWWSVALEKWNNTHKRNRDQAKDVAHFKQKIKGYESYISMINNEESHRRYLKDFASISYE